MMQHPMASLQQTPPSDTPGIDNSFMPLRCTTPDAREWLQAMDPSTGSPETSTGAFPMVVLHHELDRTQEGRASHWDLMVALDATGPLKTWALDALPDFDHAEEMVVTGRALPDHRRIYLTFEGTLSGQRGTVHRVWSGTARRCRTEPSRRKDRSHQSPDVYLLSTGSAQWKLTIESLVDLTPTERPTHARATFRFCRVSS